MQNQGKIPEDSIIVLNCMVLLIPHVFSHNIAVSSSSAETQSLRSMGPLCGFLQIHIADRTRAGESLSAAISLLFNLSGRLERTALHIPLM